MVVDHGYETSPAPSLNESIDFGSDYSVKDPPYAASEHSSDIISSSDSSAPASPTANRNPSCSFQERTTQDNEMNREIDVPKELPKIVVPSNIKLKNIPQTVHSVSYIAERVFTTREV